MPPISALFGDISREKLAAGFVAHWRLSVAGKGLGLPISLRLDLSMRKATVLAQPLEDETLRARLRILGDETRLVATSLRWSSCLQERYLLERACRRLQADPGPLLGL